MDTNDLTEMAYKVIWLAEEVSLELRAELGASASDYTTDQPLNPTMIRDVSDETW